MDQSDFGTLCVCALRYCHGRQTYMPSLVQEIVKANIDKISDKDIRVMRDDCDFQQRFDLYGDTVIDKPGWIEWREFLDNEIIKRNEKKYSEQ